MRSFVFMHFIRLQFFNSSHASFLYRFRYLLDQVPGDHSRFAFFLCSKIAGKAVQIDAQAGGLFAVCPWARRLPIIPVSTSPVPPVAMPGLPVELMNTRPSGDATTVPAPFSTSVTLYFARESGCDADPVLLHVAAMTCPAALPFRRDGAS